MNPLLASFAIGACMSSAIAAPATHQDWKQQFQQVSDAYLDQVYFHYAPMQGTLAGYHQYDAQMENCTLGKLEILKLRADMMKKEGAAFSLEKFHNEFLNQGFPPIKIVREAMLGDDSPAL